MPARGHADKGEHGGRILARDVQATDRIGSARSPRDKAHTRLAGDLAPGLGHHGGATPLSADDGFDPVGIMQSVERGKKALAGHSKGAGGALDLQLIDEEFATVTHRASWRPAPARLPRRAQPAKVRTI